MQVDNYTVCNNNNSNLTKLHVGSLFNYKSR